jgi:hypothetical protein
MSNLSALGLTLRVAPLPGTKISPPLPQSARCHAQQESVAPSYASSVQNDQVQVGKSLLTRRVRRGLGPRAMPAPDYCTLLERSKDRHKTRKQVDPKLTSRPTVNVEVVIFARTLPGSEAAITSAGGPVSRDRAAIFGQRC